MRISDWSSDVCSSDLLFKMERLVRGDAVFIAGAVGDHRPRADRDQYLARRHRSSADQQGVWAGHRSTVEHDLDAEIGRASCRERVCQDVEIVEVAVSLKKKKSPTLELKISYYK